MRTQGDDSRVKIETDIRSPLVVKEKDPEGKQHTNHKGNGGNRYRG